MANINIELPGAIGMIDSVFGKKWGKGIKGAYIILPLVAIVVVIFTTLFGHFSIKEFYAFLGWILVLVGIVSVPMMLGLFFGMIMQVGFAIPIMRVDNTLNKLLLLLRKAIRDKLDRKIVKQLLDDTEKLETRWSKSKIVRFIHWWNRPKSKKVRKEG